MREQGHIEPMPAYYGIAHYEYTRTPSKEKPQQFADDVCDPAQLDTANTLWLAVVIAKQFLLANGFCSIRRHLRALQKGVRICDILLIHRQTTSACLWSALVN